MPTQVNVSFIVQRGEFSPSAVHLPAVCTEHGGRRAQTWTQHQHESVPEQKPGADTGQPLKPLGLTRSSGSHLWCETKSQTQPCFWMSLQPEAWRTWGGKASFHLIQSFCTFSQSSGRPPGPLTRSMRMDLPEQELVVKNSSRPLIRATTRAAPASTLPFLLGSSFFKHCCFHRTNSCSIFIVVTSCSNTGDFMSSASRRLIKLNSIVLIRYAS